jgi:hypothetical protein
MSAQQPRRADHRLGAAVEAQLAVREPAASLGLSPAAAPLLRPDRPPELPNAPNDTLMVEALHLVRLWAQAQSDCIVAVAVPHAGRSRAGGASGGDGQWGLGTNGRHFPGLELTRFGGHLDAGGDWPPERSPCAEPPSPLSAGVPR